MRRYYTSYRSHARSVRSMASQVTNNVPGTDTFGTAFKMVTIAGLIGLGIFHPAAVNRVLTKATATVRTIITGGK